MTPPTIECVVETGSSMYVAISSHVAAAVSAHSMPYAKTSGLAAK